MTSLPHGAFLIGDAAYKHETYMMVPHKDSGKFDFFLQQKYNVIERAFCPHKIQI